MASLGFNFTASAVGLPWDEYFREYRVALELIKNPSTEDEVDVFAVTSPAVKIAVTDLGTSPKGVWLKAQALGWEPQAWRSETWHEAVRLKEDGKSGFRGDIRTPAHARRHYLIRAKHPTARLGFSATWMGKSDGKSASFDSATVIDPAGVPVELFTKAQPATYNDRTDYIVHRYHITTTAEFILWVEDWLMLNELKENAA